MTKIAAIIMTLIFTTNLHGQNPKKILPPDAKKNRKFIEKQMQENVDEKIKSYLFPDWPRPSFDYSLRPVAAAVYTDIENEERTRTRTLDSEFGLRGSLDHIPIIEGHPALYLGSRAGYSWGRGDSLKSSDNRELVDTSYRRMWLGLDIEVPWHFLKNTFSLTLGRQTSNDDSYQRKSFRIEDDLGLLVLSSLSGHLTYNYLRGYSLSLFKPYLTSQDIWIHALWAPIPILNLDLGPGTATYDEFLDVAPNHQIHRGYSSLYFQSKLDFNPFWLLYLSSEFRYIASSTESSGGVFTGQRAADQNLYETRAMGLTGGSYTLQSFIGITNLFGGLGFGYHDLLISSNEEKADGQKDKKTTHQSGIGLTFSASY